MATEKENEKINEEVIPEKNDKKEKKNEKAEETVVYRVAKKKNFVGFVHPDTRRLVTGNKDGEFIVKKADEKAIAILENAADLHEA